MYNVDMLSSNVVGMVGAPIDITSTVDFDYATITFTYDEALLNGTPEENLAILWYDETNDRYVILDEETVVDVENNTVSYTTTHFSTYLVIDREVWYDCWRENIDYRNSPVTIETAYDISFVVDVSGSMDGERLNRAKTALNTFIDAMYPCDNACLVKFNSSGSVVSKYGSSISELKSAVSSLYASGGTSTNSGLLEAIDELSPNLSEDKTAMIILICDGDVEYNAATMVLINKAIINNIAIHTINVCDSASSILSEISKKTGGTYYVAKTSSEIASVMAILQQKTVSSIDITDSDGDGLYDVYEVNGMKIQNGQIIKTDPNKADSDNDGVSDFDEIGCAPIVEMVKFAESEYSCVLFKSKSNPWASDSDGDYYPDDIDEFKNIWNKSSVKDKYIDDTDSAKGKNPVESSDVYTNGVLTQIIMGKGGTMKKNAYSFTRSNDLKYKHNGYSSTFSLRPKKESFYAITVTNVNSKDDVDIKVTYVNERFILKDKTIKVNQYSDADFDSENHTATFYYLLEPDNDTAYTICINNNTNCDTYEVKISQDNWVYAPNGGKQEIIPYNFYFPMEKMYIPSDALIEAIRLSSNNSIIINGNQSETSIEDQTTAIMKSLGIDNTSKLVFDAALTVVSAIYAGSATAAALVDPEPTTKAVLVAVAADGITTYFLISSTVGVFNFMESNDFKKACYDGNLNLIFTKAGYASMFNDLWDPWTTSDYIYKFLNDSMNGRALAKITLNKSAQDIVDYCGF